MRKSTIFNHWGKSSCSNSNELVYTGFYIHIIIIIIIIIISNLK